MIRPTTKSQLTYTLFPNSTLFRSRHRAVFDQCCAAGHARRGRRSDDRRLGTDGAGPWRRPVRDHPGRGRRRRAPRNRRPRTGRHRLNRSTWHDHDWLLLHEAPQSPALHMALDDVLVDEVSAGRRAPTLRIWEWAGPAVVMGRFQSLRNEVDQEAAQRHGIDIVRRISGGGAMFIEPGNTITYSIYAPLDMVHGMNFEQAYALMDAWVKIGRAHV